MLGNLVTLISGLSLAKLVVLSVVLDMFCIPVVQMIIYKVLLPVFDSIPRAIGVLLRIITVVFLLVFAVAVLVLDIYTFYRIFTWIF